MGANVHAIHTENLWEVNMAMGEISATHGHKGDGLHQTTGLNQEPC